jgi:hypothetical protein
MAERGGIIALCRWNPTTERIMLTAADIRDRVRLRPFRPLRIVTSSSETYDV